MRLTRSQLDRTFVSGHWMLADSRKNSAEHYYKLISKTLDMLAGCRRVFFYGHPELMHFLENHLFNNRIEPVPSKSLSTSGLHETTVKASMRAVNGRD